MQHRKTATVAVFLSVIVAFAVVGTQLPDVFAAGTHCKTETTQGTNCYATSIFNPGAYIYDRGVKATYKAFDGSQIGTVLGATWVVTNDLKILETGWIDKTGEVPHWYCAYNGHLSLGTEWTSPVPTPGTYYTYTIEYSGTSNDWDTDANGQTCTKDGGSTDALRLEVGYETAYGDSNLSDMIVKDKKSRETTYWALWTSSSGSHSTVERHYDNEYEVVVNNNYYKTTHKQN